MRIVRTVVEYYEADPDELKAEFPDEYSQFLEGSADDSDEAWLRDCFCANPDLFEREVVEDEIEVEP